ncbi:hypothetical protein CONPUDRAFT_156258 [Coniophora puteana RWD-64-598 SS2]|uniref:Uncharacterized protein n=1 Tax=Coniophora puteana (strain RWD-64-598) TaxID=741705 RepID=A0A5M3MH38_CONPW|nr:uncharacterized protein CONPUDRAFT_156258 [Coniophora puteana RWD-64-598 SS2]EIW78260.1 hypothetical protein CONPUDRAFT_156258 [Coniophora puteana RWD-64-598 SS2]
MNQYPNNPWPNDGPSQGYSYADEREKKKQTQAQYRDEERQLIRRLQVLTGSPDKRATVLQKSADQMEDLVCKVKQLTQENQVLKAQLERLSAEHQQLQIMVQQQQPQAQHGGWDQTYHRH